MRPARSPFSARLLRVALAVACALCGLLFAPLASAAGAPMCDETGASVDAPAPVLPAPFASDGEIRQGEPCKKRDAIKVGPDGTAPKPRADASWVERFSDQGFSVITVRVNPQSTRTAVFGPHSDVPPPDATLPRVYRPPRRS